MMRRCFGLLAFLSFSVAFPFKLRAQIASAEQPDQILTPPAARTPRINGPKIFGVRPGSPFLYSIPATGDRPMTFSADGLPDGLQLDPANGHITGTLNSAGEYKVTLHAKNS